MKTKIKIQSISAWSIGIALILTVVFVVILHYGKNEVKRFEDATDQYIVCENAARQLQDGSDYLTEQVRLYAMTGERNYLDQYFEEADVTKRREQALESLKKYFDKTEAFQSLQQAMEDSKELMRKKTFRQSLSNWICRKRKSSYHRKKNWKKHRNWFPIMNIGINEGQS